MFLKTNQNFVSEFNSEVCGHYHMASIASKSKSLYAVM